jgi:hypothetical protein
MSMNAPASVARYSRIVSVSGGVIRQSMVMRWSARCTFSVATCTPFGISGVRAPNTSGLPRRPSDHTDQT